MSDPGGSRGRHSSRDGLPPFSDVNPSRRTPDQIARNNDYIEIFDKAFFK